MKNKKIWGIGVTTCLLCSLGLAQSASAWLVDTNVSVPVDSNNNTDSRNDNSIDLNSYSRYSSTSDSNNRYQYDSRYQSVRDGFNTDNRVDSSFRDSHAYAEWTGGNKRVNSSDFNIAGSVRNSNLGDFSQLYRGTDFNGTLNSSSNTIDSTSVNITTFGDTLSQQAKE